MERYDLLLIRNCLWIHMITEYCFIQREPLLPPYSTPTPWSLQVRYSSPSCLVLRAVSWTRHVSETVAAHTFTLHSWEKFTRSRYGGYSIRLLYPSSTASSWSSITLTYFTTLPARITLAIHCGRTECLFASLAAALSGQIILVYAFPL